MKQAREKLINEYSHNIAQLQMDLGDMKENKETRKNEVGQLFGEVKMKSRMLRHMPEE